MKKFLLLFSAIVVLGTVLEQPLFSQEDREWENISPLKEKLEALHDVTEVNTLEKGPFDAKFEVMITQPLDYANPQAGSFQQRFYVLHRGADRPTVMVTEGYKGSYAANPKFTNEIAERYQANIILVEHRYFERSTPAPRNWDYLTVENSMNDLHRINETMRKIYNGKWIATGISKGGQTTIMYKTYFPDDVDVSVPYVAPVCFGVEDGRHEPFLAQQCGTPEDRARILAFQKEILQRRDELQPAFRKYCDKKELKFRIPIEEVYDYCVLEYTFAFWQWGTDTNSIPAPRSDAKTMLAHLIKVAGPDYFAIKDEPSFYVQAARELGYYGYDTKPFKGLLTIKNSKGYLHRIMMPEDALHYKFSNKVHRDIYKYLKQNDPKMICVYGEYDPWSAPAVDPKLFEGKENLSLMVEKAGSHRARINTLSDEQQKQVWGKIDQWLKN